MARDGPRRKCSKVTESFEGSGEKTFLSHKQQYKVKSRVAGEVHCVRTPSYGGWRFYFSKD